MNVKSKTVLFWAGAVLLMVLASILYQPAAARTGSLLVWTRNHIYVMDIDSLSLERIGPAAAGEPITPSPGCFGAAPTPCWVAVSNRLYRVEVSAGGTDVEELTLPLDDGYKWANGVVSWSPDGVHLAYSVRNADADRHQLRVLSVPDGQIAITADDADPEVAVAWRAACADGLTAENCEIGYKKMPAQQEQGGFLATLVGFSPATRQVRQWSVSPERLFELRWAGDELLYSRPKRNFLFAADHTPAYHLPPGAKLANMSPDAEHTVYYQPFTLTDCQQGDHPENCMHLGVWLEKSRADNDRSLIYSVDLTHQSAGLNFVPVWAPAGQAFVFFQEGKLIYYDIEKQEATIWYKGLQGKLRSLPVFSPNEEAVAFVDSQGQGFSQYRLVVVNPRLQPVENIIDTTDGFKVLAWLPN
ncbi:MAG: hypothetical protein D6768_17535 [Chloroflexi bacterium]|nr:MAG: hypothetical protein D6768_17535 [Chloroflexota bacterium]